jgi:hypothetical protein
MGRRDRGESGGRGVVKIDRHILYAAVAGYALDHFAEDAVRLHIGGG